MSVLTSGGWPCRYDSDEKESIPTFHSMWAFMDRTEAQRQLLLSERRSAQQEHDTLRVEQKRQTDRDLARIMSQEAKTALRRKNACDIILASQFEVGGMPMRQWPVELDPEFDTLIAKMEGVTPAAA